MWQISSSFPVSRASTGAVNLFCLILVVNLLKFSCLSTSNLAVNLFCLYCALKKLYKQIIINLLLNIENYLLVISIEQFWKLHDLASKSLPTH